MLFLEDIERKNGQHSPTTYDSARFTLFALFQESSAAGAYWRLQSATQPLVLVMLLWYQGIARTQSPTIKNDAFELPTFGVIVGVSPTEVQWKGLTLEEPPS